MQQRCKPNDVFILSSITNVRKRAIVFYLHWGIWSGDLLSSFCCTTYLGRVLLHWLPTNLELMFNIIVCMIRILKCHKTFLIPYLSYQMQIIFLKLFLNFHQTVRSIVTIKIRRLSRGKR